MQTKRKDQLCREVMTISEGFPEAMRGAEAGRVKKGGKREGKERGRRTQEGRQAGKEGATKKLGKVTECDLAEPGSLKKLSNTHCCLLICYRPKLNTHGSLKKNQ